MKHLDLLFLVHFNQFFFSPQLIKVWKHLKVFTDKNESVSIKTYGIFGFVSLSFRKHKANFYLKNSHSVRLDRG